MKLDLGPVIQNAINEYLRERGGLLDEFVMALMYIDDEGERALHICRSEQSTVSNQLGLANMLRLQAEDTAKRVFDIK